jgi:hypothetical protein
MKKILIILFYCLSLTGQAQTRLGLHVTQEELTIWRNRANSGPYKNPSDVQTNSPVAWARIAQNAVWFKGTSTDSTQRLADRFVPTGGTGCYPSNTAVNAPNTKGNLLKDAAFYALIKQDATYTDKLRREILRYVRNPALDMSNKGRWCPLGQGSPAFEIPEWLIKVTHAYDYVRIAGGFTAPEQAELNAWIKNCGLSIARNVDGWYADRFVDRMSGNYGLTNTTTYQELHNPKFYMYYGSPQVGTLGSLYNNRFFTQVNFIAAAGVLTNDAFLQNCAKRWYFEWLKYGVYPGGDIADMSRSLDAAGTSEKGFNYSMGMIGVAISVADVFARKGDRSLYDTTFTIGVYGSESPGNPKGLLQIIQNFQAMMNGSKLRYAVLTNPASLTSQQRNDTLMNGTNPRKANSDIVYDVWFSQANRYYKNAGVENNYRRITVGNRPYPLYPLSFGPNYPWSVSAIYPGSLFMFGQMEDESSPYPVDRFTQSLSFPDVPDRAYPALPATLTASASSGLAVTISVISGPATLSGSTLTFTGAGVVRLKAVQAGNSTYLPAPEVTQDINVKKGDQTIALSIILDKVITDANFTLSATSSVGLPVSIVSENSAVVPTGSLNEFAVNALGEASIRASQAGNSNYNSASIVRKFNVRSAIPVGTTNVLISAIKADTVYKVGSLPTNQVFQFKRLYYLSGAKNLSRIIFTTKILNPWTNLQIRAWNGTSWIVIRPKSVMDSNEVDMVTSVSGALILEFLGDGKAFSKIEEGGVLAEGS